MAAIAVPIQRIDKTLDMPAYAYPGDAGLDLSAAEAAVLKPFERKLVLRHQNGHTAWLRGLRHAAKRFGG